MQSLMVLEIAYLAIPVILTGGALAMSWRTLRHRWLFGAVGFLALVGLQFLIRGLAIAIETETFVASSRDSTVAAIHAEDAISIAEASSQQLTLLTLGMVFSLLITGVLLLWWLRNALQLSPRMAQD
jgi:hypothetical protein